MNSKGLWNEMIFNNTISKEKYQIKSFLWLLFHQGVNFWLKISMFELLQFFIIIWVHFVGSSHDLFKFQEKVLERHHVVCFYVMSFLNFRNVVLELVKNWIELCVVTFLWECNALKIKILFSELIDGLIQNLNPVFLLVFNNHELLVFFANLSFEKSDLFIIFLLFFFNLFWSFFEDDQLLLNFKTEFIYFVLILFIVTR